MDCSAIRFGGYQLDLAQRRLARDKEAIPLGGRAFDLLAVLATSGGRIVSKRELLDKVWPDVVVGENNLHVQMRALRQTLGKDSNGLDILMTVHGRGYKLLGARPEFDPSLPAKPAPSLAVLPFREDASTPPEQFAEALVEEIVTTLSQMSTLSVVATSSTRTFSNDQALPTEIGLALNVAYVVCGTVRRHAGNAAIHVELIDVVTNTNLWADRFQTETVELFDIVQRIACKIVAAIAPRIEKEEIARALRKPTESLAAYDWFLRALAGFNERTRESLGAAIESCDRASQIDSEFATPIGLKSCCYMLRRLSGWADDAANEQEKGLISARLAAEKGRHDPRALAFAGLALSQMGSDPRAGLPLVDRALALTPSLTIALIASGWIRTIVGEYDVAIEHLEKAEQLSPVDPFLPAIRSARATSNFFLGNHELAARDAALAVYERASLLPALRILAAASALLGDNDRARATVSEIMRQDPQLSLKNLETRLPRYPSVGLEKLRNALELAGLPA